MSFHWPSKLTLKQKRKVNNELHSLGQPDVEEGIEEYLATNEFLASDYSGSSSAVTGILAGISVVFGIWFVDAIPLGFKVYVVVFAGLIAGIPLLSMHRNSSHDATRRATIAIVRERASDIERNDKCESCSDPSNKIAL